MTNLGYARKTSDDKQRQIRRFWLRQKDELLGYARKTSDDKAGAGQWP
jgi:hypothetical protein